MTGLNQGGGIKTGIPFRFQLGEFFRKLPRNPATGSSTSRPFEGARERPKAAHFLRIQTPHVIGPASLSFIWWPASLRASFI